MQIAIVVVGMVLIFIGAFIIGVRAATKVERQKFDTLYKMQQDLVVYIMHGLNSDGGLPDEVTFNVIVKEKMDDIVRMREEIK